MRSHVEGNEGCYKWYQSQRGCSTHKGVVCKISCQGMLAKMLSSQMVDCEIPRRGERRLLHMVSESARALDPQGGGL